MTEKFILDVVQVEVKAEKKKAAVVTLKDQSRGLILLWILRWCISCLGGDDCLQDERAKSNERIRNFAKKAVDGPTTTR